MKTTAVILSGGSGIRAGLDIPKQFAVINNAPMIAHSIHAFNRHPMISSIILVSRTEDIPGIKDIIKKFSFTKASLVIPGGSTRQQSSFNGIAACSCDDDDIVLIHDAARPFVSEKTITNTINSARINGAALAAVSPVDTILVNDNGFIKEALDRSKLVCAQTPQGFKYGIIKTSHKQALEDGFLTATDDTILVTRRKIPCAIVEGDTFNIKVTNKPDFQTAETIAREIQFPLK